MVRNEECSLEHYGFAQAVHDDVSVFMNLQEFARKHEIDGEVIVCVFISAKQQRNSYLPVSTKRMILFVPMGKIREPLPNTQTRIDGLTYVVLNVHDIQGEIWRIDLETSYN